VSGSEQDYLLPLDRGDLVARLHREGTVSKVDYRDDGILIRAGTDGRIAALLREYEYHE
jgi:GTP-binding protein HflX